MDTLPETALAEFVRYNNWANQQLLEACQNLSEDQLAATVPGSYGTIRATLAHIITGEEFYVELLTGQRPQPPFRWDATPGLDEMKGYAAQVGDALVDAINHVGPRDRICENDQGKKFWYKALAVFIQIINHGVEHRTNITTILSANQHAHPDVDGWGYLSAQPDRFDLEGG
jgi:uncharacterized damage-inducible protein DinB